MEAEPGEAPPTNDPARIRAEAATDGAIGMAFLCMLPSAGGLAALVMDHARSMWLQPVWWVIVPPVWIWLWAMQNRYPPAIRLVPIALIGSPLSCLVAGTALFLFWPADDVVPLWQVAMAAAGVASFFSALGWYAYVNSLIRWRDLPK